VTPEELANLAHVRRARDRIDREYAQPLDVAALARTALMSTAHFSRQFRAAYGETPYSYLMTRRIERAKALLRVGELSVTEVCLEVGPGFKRSLQHRSDFSARIGVFEV
jgi:AraC-like DNA-binding protein